MGGQVITFFIGQCGIQLGNSCWELYCLEHCISPDGQCIEDIGLDDCAYEALFFETESGYLVPRTIFIDMEPTVLDELKVGTYRQLFEGDWLVNGYEDAANNFARGFYSCGKSVVRRVVAATRRVVEGSDNIEAFMCHHSFGGGTGSGFTSLFLEYLASEYAKVNQVEFGVFPSSTMSTSVVEPYNTVLAMHTPMDNVDLAAFVENESLYRICTNNLKVDSPLYTHINRLSAQVISGLTCSMRFEGPLNANIVDYQTNLVPYPRIHFPTISFSPFSSLSKTSLGNISTREITASAFGRDNQMVGINPLKGVYMSCCLLYRGNVNRQETNEAVQYLKSCKRMRWVDWCPTGYKIGINYQPMLAIPASGMSYNSRSVTILCNSSAVKQIIGRINCKFMQLYSRNSFVHWYVAEGMEDDEFKEAFEDILTLEKDYELLDQNSPADQDLSNSNIRRDSLRKLENIERNLQYKKQSDNSSYLPSSISSFENKPFGSANNFFVSKNTLSDGIIQLNDFIAQQKVHLSRNQPMESKINTSHFSTPTGNSDIKNESNICSILRGLSQNPYREDHRHQIAYLNRQSINKLNSLEELIPCNSVGKRSCTSTKQNTQNQDQYKKDDCFLRYLLTKLDQRPFAKVKRNSAVQAMPSNKNNNLLMRYSSITGNSSKVPKFISGKCLANHYLL